MREGVWVGEVQSVGDTFEKGRIPQKPQLGEGCGARSRAFRTRRQG